MRPTATITLAGDSIETRRVTLGHGDLIGRLDSAALHINDPRISEAHAMVSLRGAGLHLLALRGRFTVRGKPLPRVQLADGMEVVLARGISLTVTNLVLPDSVLAVRYGTVQSRVLSGVSSILGPPVSDIRPGFHRDAAAYLWAQGQALQLRQPGQPDRRLDAGDITNVAGVALAIEAIPLTTQGLMVTKANGGVASPLEIVTRYESASIVWDRDRTLHLTGISAKILSEVGAFGAPVGWATMAAELWPEDVANLAAGGQREARVRAKWDVNLGRLRKKLEAGGVRPDLVRSDGNGNVEMVLAKGDVLRDET